MSIVQKLQDFARVRRAMRELNSLDDRRLNDLGISRGDIRSAVLGRR